ncbi:hypothetical protein PF006_g17647 [Phytophthora fragariae]|uniref:Uncharacterized protein n=1 Tax=Phytophthora fragariae TaxID=53985 RepID=A0A6A3EII2_9STRA|nr:hypothetical protein PF003_g21473 [Phytophthora fragariae]KAE8932057.1 hypothetical protein PF009_g17903 [Phytophthora fragariae]KAE9122467.1 hypothetical protein PF006_g17647 [Phytophthora fragariae]
MIVGRRSNAKAGWGALRCGAVSSVAFSPLLGVVTASGFSLDANVGGLATGTTAVEDWTAAFKPATDGPCVTWSVDFSMTIGTLLLCSEAISRSCSAVTVGSCPFSAAPTGPRSSSAATAGSRSCSAFSATW